MEHHKNMQKNLITFGLAILFCCVLVAAKNLYAQDVQTPADNAGLSSNSDDPLEITADGSLEWKRNDKQFIARKNAKAVQGTSSVAAQTLVADYREENGNDFNIWQVTATQSVVLQSNDSNAYGDNANYNLDSGLAVMTGGDLKMISPEQTITAKEKFEYWVNDGRLVAVGSAKVQRPADSLEADTITAVMKDTPGGERKLETLEAEGNVVITTTTEVLRGNYGIYRAADNKAEIKGKVKLTRGPNVLEGDRAEVDLTTNVSKIFGHEGASGSAGQVRGVFYPNSEKKPEQTP
jgi:lipopolysaccharide export system protein LptA